MGSARAVGIGVVLAAVTVGGCSLDKANGDPPLVGPSEFGLSVTMTATPDQLPRDGRSQSVVTVTVRDDRSRPVAGRRLGVASSVGTVSQSEIVTTSDGRASFAFTAPPANVPAPGNVAVVQVVPIGTDVSNAVPSTIGILLTGGSNATAPNAESTFEPEDPVLKEQVVFDASATTDEGAVCGDRCTYAWDFGGDGTATGRIVTHQLTSVKTFAVKLTVTDAAGSIDTETQNIAVAQGTAPTASFTFAPTSPGQFETVRFTAEASRVGEPGRTISKFEFRFGDGTSATGAVVSKAFSVLGTFPVVLTVTDSAGVQGTTTQNVTVVSGVTADFTVSPTNPRPGETVVLNAEASKGSAGFGSRNPITKYIWNFGTGADTVEESDPITTTTFPAARTYTVNLTVEDNAGRRATVSKTVAVTN